MNIFESISSALSGITGNKMRAILTMFGIVVGISSVIMITSIGEGYKVNISEQFEAMGLDNLTLSLDYGDSVTIEMSDIPTYDDVVMLRKYEDLVEVGAEYYLGFGNAIETLDPNTIRGAYFRGVDMQYCNINKLDLIYGRNIVTQDVENESKVCIIDEDLAVQVFGTAECVGETLSFDLWSGKVDMTVVGVIASDSYSQMRAMYGQMAYIYCPITFVQGIFNQPGYVDNIVIKAGDTSRLHEISDNVIRIMEFNHQNEDKYRIYSVADDMSQVNTVIGIFTIFLGVVAGISLLVGGIGVMNIMLVSVTERTREIGIRKSLGATNWNVQFQFLIEAVILTAIGGTVGIFLGYLGGLGISSLVAMAMGQQIAPYISPSTVVGVVAFSGMIGIVFGVYPASQAAKLDPIEALRFE